VQQPAVRVGDIGGRLGVGRLVTPAGLEGGRRFTLGGGRGGAGGGRFGEAPDTFGRLRLQQGLGLPQPRQPSGLGGERLGQLVVTRLAVFEIVALVGRGGLAQDLGDLGVEPVQGAVGLVGGVAGQLCAVQGDHADLDHPGRGAQLERGDQESGQALLVPYAERAMVTWSGVWLAPRTRKAMSSVQRRSSWREERTPRQ
jgi:hypothetical protein